MTRITDEQLLLMSCFDEVSIDTADVPALARELLLARAVVEAARNLPRRTPAPGGAGTEHTFEIAAAFVWANDRALTAYDEATP